MTLSISLYIRKNTTAVALDDCVILPSGATLSAERAESLGFEFDDVVDDLTTLDAMMLVRTNSSTFFESLSIT